MRAPSRGALSADVFADEDTVAVVSADKCGVEYAVEEVVATHLLLVVVIGNQCRVCHVCRAYRGGIADIRVQQRAS